MEWTLDRAQEFGRLIRELREAKGLSQERLAYDAHLTKNAIQLIEAGRGSGLREERERPSNPRMSTLFALAQALDVSVGRLLSPDQ